MPNEVEFVTLMWFDSIVAVRSFAGPDYGIAVVPPEAQQLLARFDTRSAHYTVTERRSVQEPGDRGRGRGERWSP